ncbi:Uncharacterised protein [Nocardia cyriacigeorgica]|uniref:Uncharacterized protein n=1 Tax=Nocardia cyriacigeorgica TaxID=135487 RepID=A0A4V6ICP7_9NOCA|nr:Uncharacterised protein [Nocardia cyriacigeorgica]
MSLKVEFVDVAPHKVDRRGSVGQLQSAPVAARCHNRNRQRAWDRTVDPSGRQPDKGYRLDTLVCGGDTERCRLELG